MIKTAHFEELMYGRQPGLRSPATFTRHRGAQHVSIIRQQRIQRRHEIAPGACGADRGSIIALWVRLRLPTDFGMLIREVA